MESSFLKNSSEQIGKWAIWVKEVQREIWKSGWQFYLDLLKIKEKQSKSDRFSIALVPVWGKRLEEEPCTFQSLSNPFGEVKNCLNRWQKFESTDENFSKTIDLDYAPKTKKITKELSQLTG